MTDLTSTGGPSAADIAARFVTANEEAVAFVLGPARAHWQTPTGSEGWPLGVTARHIALGHVLMAGWARAIAAGEPIASVADIHEINAEQAALGVVADPDEVAQLLRDGAVAVTDALSTLSDELLTGEVDFGGQAMPARGLAEASVRHVRTHLESMQAVVAAAARADA